MSGEDDSVIAMNAATNSQSSEEMPRARQALQYGSPLLMNVAVVPPFTGSTDAGTAYIIEQLRALATTQNLILSRVSALEMSGAVSSASRVHASSTVWECPVCLKPFKHRSSFKGHIFRLAHPSSRPKCHLSPRNPDHVKLLDDPRFAADTFQESAEKFYQCYWHTVHELSSSTLSSEQSNAMIQAWLKDDNGEDSDLAPFSAIAHIDGGGLAPDFASSCFK